MLKNPKIIFLDDDHIIKLARFALVGESEVSRQWTTAFFSPQSIDLNEITQTAYGLQPADGVELIPASSMTNAQEIQLADILIFRRGPVTKEILDQFPNLKFIQRLGQRFDDIDLIEAKRRGITVSCLPRKSLHLTAEHSVLFMLALSKQLIKGDQSIRQSNSSSAFETQNDQVAYNWIGMDPLGGLFGKTLGIIGLGEVGKLLAKLVLTFGMKVIYHNRKILSSHDSQELSLEYLDLNNLLAQSDFVSINATNIPSNIKMVNSDFFSKMKKTAYFINTSRGQLVDEDALYEALKTQKIAGAAIDVHAIEPRPSASRLCELDNLIMTPHYAGGSRRGILDELNAIFENCRLFINDQLPYFCI